MNRQLNITLVTERKYKNYIDKYEIQIKPLSVLIQGIGTSFIYQFKKCFHMCGLQHWCANRKWLLKKP